MISNKYLFLPVLLFSFFISHGQDHWIKFSPEDKSFEVMVPGEMRDGQKKVFTEIGEIYPTTWVYTNEKDKDPNFLYMVSIIDYPEMTLNDSDEDFIDDFFNETLAQHVEDIKGELIYDAEKPLGHYPGRVFRASWRNGDFVVRGRMVLVKDRFYMLQVYTEKSFSLNDEAQWFLDSLKVSQDK